MERTPNNEKLTLRQRAGIALVGSVALATAVFGLTNSGEAQTTCNPTIDDCQPEETLPEKEPTTTQPETTTTVPETTTTTAPETTTTTVPETTTTTVTPPTTIVEVPVPVQPPTVDQPSRTQ